MKITSIPVTEELFDRFTVTMNGAAVPVSAARVSAEIYNTEWPGCQRPLDQTEMAGFVRCESDEPVNVCVTVKEPVKEVCVRPLSKKIAVEQKENTLCFTLPGAGQYVLEVNDHHGALHLFVAPEITLPELKDGDLYFGPGTHEPGIVLLHDDQTVVLDAGAVVYGSFIAAGSKNITITGTGILDGSHEKRTDGGAGILAIGGKEVATRDHFFSDMTGEELHAYVTEHKMLPGSIRFYGCQNCTVEHITCRDASNWSIALGGCDNMIFDDIKQIGMWRYNSDGIDIYNSSNCIIRNCFLRNFDDCVVIKGMVGWGHRNLENILTENCVIWCDWGRELEIGAETNALEYRNITFRNCDLLHGSWLRLDIQHHNDAHIHDILFDDIRCEYTKHQQPLKFQHDMNRPYEEETDIWFEQPGLLGAFFVNRGLFGGPACGKKIERIVFRNIQVLSDEEVPMPTCRFEGLDEQNCIDGVTIENLTRNGVRLTDPKAANLSCNEFAYNITLK